MTRFSRHLNKVSYPQSKFNQENFHEFAECVNQEKYDVIIPVGAHSVNLLSQNRDIISPFAKLPLAPHEAISLAFRKDYVVNLAKKVAYNAKNV